MTARSMAAFVSTGAAAMRARGERWLRAARELDQGRPQTRAERPAPRPAVAVRPRVLPATAVEELLRWDAPLQLFERWVLEEGVEIAGRPIAVGEEVAMLFGSAQRDPRRFDDPDVFDVGRGDAAHIGFGGGIHFCIGAPLARQELARSVAGFVERFPDLRLVEEPTYHPTFVIRGLTALRLATR